MDEVIARVTRKWTRWATGVRAGALEADLCAFERQHGVAVPDSMRRLWLAADGMEAGCVPEDDLIRFWPVAEWSLASEQLGMVDHAALGDLSVFADYSLWAHAYAIRFREGSVYLVAGAVPVSVAPSFDAFLGQYLDGLL